MKLNNKILNGLLIGLALCTTFTACVKEKEKTSSLGTRVESFTATQSDGSKVYLNHHEEWLYWEIGDEIAVFTDSDGRKKFSLKENANRQRSWFEADDGGVTLGEKAWGIYPYSTSAAKTEVDIPSVQPYREHTDLYADSSFGRGAIPMVAYDKDGVDSDSGLFFHVVAGIQRIQLFSGSAKQYTINSITFEEVSASPKQISGTFNVHDIDKNAPYLTAANNTSENQKITITGINQSIGGSDKDKLWTFYLPLPAVTSANAYTEYTIRMTVEATLAGAKAPVYFSRTMHTTIHRRNISMMRALDISEWSETEFPGNNGSMNVGIVGSGTSDRPFQIYYAYELQQLRDSINAGRPINGQPITRDTYIRIVRSDIELLTQSAYNALSAEEKAAGRSVLWEEGIRNFSGHMYIATTSANRGSIINKSNAPLFESISYNGIVDGVNVSGTVALSLGASKDAWSPFCYENYGEIIDCHNQCNVTVSTANKNLAGICVNNYGVISGGANQGALVMSFGGNVAGICLNNYGSVQGNFTLSSSTPQGTNIAGICYHNYASIMDCMVSVNDPINSTGNWGLVAFINEGLIRNCKSVGELAITTLGSIGGIANVMNSGTIRDCANLINLYGGSGNIGGIVASLTNGEIYNCYSSVGRNLYVTFGRIVDNAGGIVGEMTGGTIKNCYSRTDVQIAGNCGGIVGYIHTGHSAEADPIDIANCWNDYGELSFYGRIDEGKLSYCYNATPQTNCMRIYFKRSPTVMPYSTDDEGNNLLADALNDWVSYNGAGVYSQWTTQGALSIPVFAASKSSRRK